VHLARSSPTITVQLLEEASPVRFRTITKQEEQNRETPENDPQLRTVPRPDI